MVRRVNLPSADDLFRPTATDPEEPRPRAPHRLDGRPAATDREQADRAPSGRVRHEEKMTVYVTAEELVELEAARLSLRSRHGLAVDRGRLVREAIAMALADLDAEGEDSRLVRRLTSPE